MAVVVVSLWWFRCSGRGDFVVVVVVVSLWRSWWWFRCSGRGGGFVVAVVVVLL